MLQVAYWSAAASLSKHVSTELGEFRWKGVTASFLPWPTVLGYSEYWAELSPIDSLVYLLVRTNLYVLVAILVIIASGYIGEYIGSKIERG